MKVRFTKAARGELKEAVRYYESQRRGLGAEFAAEVRATIERLQAQPEERPLLSEDTRQFRTRKFPYKLVYQVKADHILIIAVAHLHREPGYWKDRT